MTIEPGGAQVKFKPRKSKSENNSPKMALTYKKYHLKSPYYSVGLVPRSLYTFVSRRLITAVARLLMFPFSVIRSPVTIPVSSFLYGL